MRQTENAFPAALERYTAGVDGLTVQEYAAIQLRVPQSGATWLDYMIREARRMDFAAAALTGICANTTWDEVPWKDVTKQAWGVAKLLAFTTAAPATDPEPGESAPETAEKT